MSEVVGTAPVADVADLVRCEGRSLAGRFVVLCDHASNRVPDGFGDLGLDEADMRRHIAWDPGALPVARALAGRLGSPLVYPDASRLLIDCNRPVDAADSMAVVSEDTSIPGNRDLAPDLRARRVAAIYDSYHRDIDAVLDARAAAGAATALVAVHTFTPVYRGKARPWAVGVLYGSDRRIADPLLSILAADEAIVVGDNEPYGPWDGVYHTLSRHGEARGLPCVMLEVRNDLVADPADQAAWARRLALALPEALGQAG